jgi:Putative peptidoglycan binding domain/HlyD family secretion protein
MRRRSRGQVIAIIVIALVLVGGGIGAVVAAGSSNDSSASTQVVTGTARRGTLTQAISATFTLSLTSTSNLVAPGTPTSAAASTSGSAASSTSGASTGGATSSTAAAGTTGSSAASSSSGQVLTDLPLSVGQTVPALQPVMRVNGTPIFSIPMGVPLYRTLVSGDTGADVWAAQKALTDAGYSIDSDTYGTYGSGTIDAVDNFQVAQGLTETGEISQDQFVSYPPGSAVLSLSAAVGDRVAAGSTVASLGVPGSLLAQASVSQSDFTKVQVGQSVALTFDALTGQTATGVVTTLPVQAQSSGSSAAAGSSTPVQYSVTIFSAGWPKDVLPGMTGTASIAVTSRTNVVIVPTSAVGGSGDNPTVQVMVNGKATTKPVVVGLSTSDGTEIITGVQPGDIVVTGTNQAQTTVSTTANGAGGPGGGGGGFGGGGGGFGGGGGGRGGAPTGTGG